MTVTWVFTSPAIFLYCGAVLCLALFIAGVDSAWEQEKLEAKRAVEYPTSGVCSAQHIYEHKTL
jgi:NADH:ubiquinone oxidoreductase subunit 6 (subunit J)